MALADADAERWVTIPSHVDYEVSSAGRVRRRTRSARGFPAGFVLRSVRHTGGYVGVSLWCPLERKYTRRFVHRLVAFAFIGEPPTSEHEVNHKNGIKDDNRAENIEWSTHIDNVRHAMRTGLAKPGQSENRTRGMRHPCSKLTDSQVTALRAARDRGLTYAELAAQFGIGKPTVANIVTGHTWKHLPPCVYPRLPAMGRVQRARIGLGPHERGTRGRERRARRAIEFERLPEHLRRTPA